MPAAENRKNRIKEAVYKTFKNVFSQVKNGRIDAAAKQKQMALHPKQPSVKTAVIDPGGGLKSVYAAGVFDRLIDEGVSFDIGIGISAGAANLCSFQAGQKERNLHFYRDYSQRKEYMSVKNMLKKHSYFDMDYIYSTLSNQQGEDPLDYEALMANPASLYIVATNALTGRPVYFDKARMQQDDYSFLKASCSLPVICRPAICGKLPYFDGACSDPVPVDKALELGAEKTVIILSQPEENQGNAQLNRIGSRFLKKFPESAIALEQSAEKYNEGIARLRKMQDEGTALIIAPDDSLGVKMISRDAKAMEALYYKGYEDGIKIKEFLETDTAG